MMTDHLFRFEVVLGILDTQATAESPGYDAESKEPLITYDAAGNRIAARGEREVRVRCLVETGTFEQPVRTPLGIDGNSSLRLVFRARHLRAAGLLDDKNRPAIRYRTRLKRIESKKGALQDDYEQLDAAGNVTGGIFITDMVPSDYGYERERDLFVASLTDDPQAPAAAG
jgi:hypothetical protein